MRSTPCAADTVDDRFSYTLLNAEQARASPRLNVPHNPPRRVTAQNEQQLL